MKSSEQHRRGIKHVRPPSDLDWQVHQLLALRNDMLQQQQTNMKTKKKKTPPSVSSNTARILPKMPPNITITSTQTSAAARSNNNNNTNNNNNSNQYNNNDSGSNVWSSMQFPLKHSLVDSEDDGGIDDGIMDEDDDCMDLSQFLKAEQPDYVDQEQSHADQSQSQHNGFNNHHYQHDALEPDISIEEMDGEAYDKPTGHRRASAKSTMPPQDLTLDDDDDDVIDEDENNDGAEAFTSPTDEYAFHPTTTSSAATAAAAMRHHNGFVAKHNQRANTIAINDADTVEHRSLRRELLVHDIRLRRKQSRYEDERMQQERELFRKRAQLLDLQIRQAGLEMKRWQQLDEGGVDEEPTVAEVVSANGTKTPTATKANDGEE